MTEETETSSRPPPLSGFSADWLNLREPADHLARSTRLTDQLAQWASRQTGLHVTELGAGTGSNLRYLCPRLGHHQKWTLVDNDPSLLTHLPRRLNQWANANNIQFSYESNTVRLKADQFSAQLTWQQCDLSENLATLPLKRNQLITGSALLDLTSANWLDKLASRCIANGCASLFVLNYNGQIAWQPELPDDTQLNDLLNAHQLSDKGFGKALGPNAGAYYAEQLRSMQNVETEHSDWVLGSEHSALQTALIEGWVPAAKEQGSTSAHPSVERWLQQRLRFLKVCESSLRVGHTDVLSLPL